MKNKEIIFLNNINTYKKLIIKIKDFYTKEWKLSRKKETRKRTN